MRWKQSPTGKMRLTKIYLDNGDKVLIAENENSKLLTLYNKLGEWVRSRLKFVRGQRVVINSYNEGVNYANQMD